MKTAPVNGSQRKSSSLQIEKPVTPALPKEHTALAYGAHLPWRAVLGSVGMMWRAAQVLRGPVVE